GCESRLPALWTAEEGCVATVYVVGFFSDRPDNPFRQPRRWCEIDQIAVDPAWRRRGVGRMLMQAALDEARARGSSDVELSSWAFNTDAHALFRSFGFEPRTVTFERRGPLSARLFRRRVGAGPDAPREKARAPLLRGWCARGRQ